MLLTSKTVQTVAEGERLVVVPIRPGVGVKMYESEARARGLWPPLTNPPEALPPEAKAQKPVRNKKRVPSLDKAGE